MKQSDIGKAKCKAWVKKYAEAHGFRVCIKDMHRLKSVKIRHRRHRCRVYIPPKNWTIFNSM